MLVEQTHVFVGGYFVRPRQGGASFAIGNLPQRRSRYR
jgi:hypothetical protein